MNLFCVGISHHTADVGTRERYARGAGAALPGCTELLVLNTCNRVELYAVADEAIGTREVTRWLAAQEEIDESDAFYRHEAEACVAHLFRVVSGFDSMVVGETEILGQAKKAYEQARGSGQAGPYLHRLFQRAFRVAKQVRTRTNITRGAVSVGSVAVDLAGKIFGDLSGLSVLVLGAGEMSERTARALVSRGVGDLRVSNRSADRGAALAEIVGARAIEFSDWLRECGEIDILICSTAADEPLVTRRMLEPIVQGRRDRPLFIIDIAVPRDVAPDVNEIEGVFLYDIDSLRSIADQSLALRRQEIAAGEAIIAEHLAAFRDWFTTRTNRVSPRAHALSDNALRVQES